MAYVLVQVSAIVVPGLVALFLASVLEPAVSALRRHGWPSWLAAGLVFLAGLLIVMGAVYWLATTVASQFDQLGGHVQLGVEKLRSWLTDGPLQLSEDQIDRIGRQLRSGARLGGLSEQLLGTARFAAQLVGGTILLLFTLFFVLKDGPDISRWLLERIPLAYREEAREIGGRTRVVLRRYLVGVAIAGLVDAVLIGIALALIGVPLVLPLAVLTFFGGFFPIVGATVAGAVAALVALVTGDLSDALMVVGATVIVQQLEGNVVQPLVFDRAVRLHPLVTAWSVGAGLILGGLVGGFLAVPVVAALAHCASYYRTRSATGDRQSA